MVCLLLLRPPPFVNELFFYCYCLMGKKNYTQKFLHLHKINFLYIFCLPVRLTLIAGLEELWTMPRAQWVLRWPGQVVIAGSQTAWTAGVENAITEFRMDYYMEEMLKQVCFKLFLALLN